MPYDKTATAQYKPATSLAGNNYALAHYEQISHALSNIHGLYRWSCNLLDVISVYSLNPGKLPARFFYEWPGYEASMYLKTLCCSIHCTTYVDTLHMYTVSACKHPIISSCLTYGCTYMQSVQKIALSFTCKFTLPLHHCNLTYLIPPTISLRLSTVEWVRESRASQTCVCCFLGRAWKNSSRSNGESFEC